MKYGILCILTGLAFGCAPKTEIGDKPYSLHGTETDGTLRMDVEGRFLADDDACRLFDYYLTAEGEIPEAALHDLVTGEIENRLPETAAVQALDVFSRYVEYRSKADAILSNTSESADVARTKLRDLHSELVGDVLCLAADATRMERAFAIREVLANPGLDRSERVARLAQIEATMTVAEDIQDVQAREQGRVHLLANAAAERVRQAGGSAAEIYAARAAQVGNPAAARLAALDDERASWQRRMDDYRVARAALVAELSDEASRERAISALIASHFDGREAMRVRALDRVDGLSAVSR